MSKLFSLRVDRWRRPFVFITAFLLALALLTQGGQGEDEIEFLSGARLKGVVTAIDKQAKKITFRATISGRTVSRVFAYSRIHAVNYRGKRYVLNPKKTTGRPSKSSAAGGRTSSRNVARQIADAGTPPEWFSQVRLDYPRSLDLKWPMPAPKPWNNRKNIGQYIWDVLNPNPNRWRGGIRFAHFLLEQHPEDAGRRQRVLRTIGSMYFRFLQDYARAAHWLQKGGVRKGDRDVVMLAECYWRLGDKATAVELLSGRTISVPMIKLWGDMGETSKAVQLAEAYVRAGGSRHHAFLAAADACRLAGQTSLAVKYYNQVLAARVGKRNREKRQHDRARASLEAIKLFQRADVSRVRDGEYQAESLGYEGPIRVAVKVQSQKIVSVQVVRHKEKQFYSALTDVPRQILKKQGVRGVDATSRATITGEAIINAAAKALAQGAP